MGLHKLAGYTERYPSAYDGEQLTPTAAIAQTITAVDHFRDAMSPLQKQTPFELHHDRVGESSAHYLAFVARDAAAGGYGLRQ